MLSLIRTLSEAVYLPLWAGMWALGGWLIAAHVFNLRRREQAIVGLGLGLVLETWFANLLAHVIPLLYSFCLAALITLGVGITQAK